MARGVNVLDIDDVIDSVDLPEGWFENLLQDDNLPALLAELANQGNITNAAFKWARMNLPSFCDEKRSELRLNSASAQAWQDCSYPPSLLLFTSSLPLFTWLTLHRLGKRWMFIMR